MTSVVNTAKELAVWLHLIIVGGALILNALAIITFSTFWLSVFMALAGIQLVAASCVAKSRSFLTPEVADPKCQFCGGYMMASKLRCRKCGAVSELPTIKPTD